MKHITIIELGNIFNDYIEHDGNDYIIKASNIVALKKKIFSLISKCDKCKYNPFGDTGEL